jgi:hypothetical protein
MKAIGLIALAILALVVALGPFRFALPAMALFVLLLAFRAVKWGFWPRADLPRNRIRHQRIRLALRLHPGRGHATWWELHRHWGRRACYRRASQVRPS